MASLYKSFGGYSKSLGVVILCLTVSLYSCKQKPENLITIKATGNELHTLAFDKKEIHIKVGQEVIIALENNSLGNDEIAEHNIVIVNPELVDSVCIASAMAGKENDYLPEGSHQIIASTELTKKYSTKRLRFTPQAKGKLMFICTVPGHYPRMKGEIIVE